MKRNFLGVVSLLTLLLFSLQNTVANSRIREEEEIESVKKIWSGPRHDAFTDLIRFKNKWFCTFRESEHHVGGNGVIRVLSSSKGEKWEPVASLTESGIDLRDPKLSITPDNRLMLVMGGSVYEGKKLLERQSRVAFSKDGKKWSATQRVLAKEDWLWRVTWHKGKAYGISYNSSATPDWTIKLVESTDGIEWRLVTDLKVPGRPNEATVRFLKNGKCVALVRREANDKQAWIGVSSAPYRDWKWTTAGMQIGGPNFVVLPDDQLFASGRKYGETKSDAKTFVGSMNFTSVSPEVILPSGGDTSYAGMVWHKGMLWLSYYSSHETSSDIYLAKIRLPKSRDKFTR